MSFLFTSGEIDSSLPPVYRAKSTYIRHHVWCKLQIILVVNGNWKWFIQSVLSTYLVLYKILYFGEYNWAIFKNMQMTHFYHDFLPDNFFFCLLIPLLIISHFFLKFQSVFLSFLKYFTETLKFIIIELTGSDTHDYRASS